MSSQLTDSWLWVSTVLTRVVQQINDPSHPHAQNLYVRLSLAAVVLAIKYQDDLYHDNEYYSKVGGISRPELNCLEVEMLSLLRFELYVHPTLFRQYVEEIKKNMFEVPSEAPASNCEKDLDMEKGYSQEVNMEDAKTLPSSAELME